MTEDQASVELATEQASGLATDISRLYRAVFSLPPFLGSEDEFQGQEAYYHQMRQNAGFQLAVAKVAGDLVGFVYGFPLPPSTGWWKAVSSGLSEEDVREDGRRTFAIIDFGVLPQYRGIGTGRMLHDLILSASQADRATLTVQEVARETRVVYDRWGWIDIGSKDGTLGGTPVVFHVYVKALRE